MLNLLCLAATSYRPMETLTYASVEGKTLTLNAFVPAYAGRALPAMVEIHGGWFEGGGPMTEVPSVVAARGLPFFSISYRLGREGGFPECIRDCRNAIRFIRKNAARLAVDPERIAAMGGSAGGHLSLMVAMVPERFPDGGPTPELRGVSAKVCGSFSWIPPTDFVRFWRQGPDDRVTSEGRTVFRSADSQVPNDARPHLRALFHGVTPETDEGAKLYEKMCPWGQIRKGLPPVLVCDGAHDPVVPGTMGRALVDRLRALGVEATYWLSDNGHDYPSGAGFDDVLNRFLDRIER